LDYDSAFPEQVMAAHEAAAQRWRKRAGKAYVKGDFLRAAAYRRNAERRQAKANELRAKVVK
jgi:hypothetical protein